MNSYLAVCFRQSTLPDILCAELNAFGDLNKRFDMDKLRTRTVILVAGTTILLLADCRCFRHQLLVTQP